ncbi:MAG TPA: glycosyltransferase family 4 protein [Ignavibacteriaceae bacterium]|nr:glycosyltransferase family 4 protein [Ignavibacteriaceae bacterium]
MKIVHIVPRVDYFGGIENYVANLIRNNSESNNQIILITFFSKNNKKLLSELLQYSIEIYQLRITLFEKVNSKYLKFVFKNNLISHFNKYKSLKYYLLKINPDLIYTHGEDSEIISSFLTNHFKIINVIHGEDYFPLNPLLRFYLERVARKKFIHTVIVNNKLKHKVPLNSNCSIINAGVDLSRFESMKSDSEFLYRKDISFGFIGRLEKQKGINKILEAFIRLNKFYSNIILEIAGSGKLEKKLKSQIPSELITKVNFRGNIEEISLFYKNIDFLIICSESEGGPLVLLEAMASGVLVITNEVGLVSEIIKNKKNGRLIKKNSIEDIFRMMKESVEEVDANKLIVKNARKTIQNYSVQKMVEKFNLLSEKLIL